METEVVLITLSCVLFVQMGLAEAVLKALHVRLPFFTCPKCLTFWSCLAWLALHGNGVALSVAASFIAAYCALWLSLLYDALALLYNRLYEQITKTTDASKGSQASSPDPGAKAHAHEVS